MVVSVMQQVSFASTPAPTARELQVRVVAPAVVAPLVVGRHYLRSMCAGVRLCFAVVHDGRVVGAIALNAGPKGAPRLVEGATTHDVLTLARLWLADELPRNSESHVLGIVVRTLRQHSTVKVLLSYADPSVAPGGVPHIGYVYQASNWIYTGTAEAQPLLDLGDGVPRHSRSVASAAGTHSVEHFRRQGLEVRLVPTVPKHRYMMLVDRRWRSRLRVPILPYPKTGGEARGDRRGPAGPAAAGAVLTERDG